MNWHQSRFTSVRTILVLGCLCSLTLSASAQSRVLLFNVLPSATASSEAALDVFFDITTGRLIWSRPSPIDGFLTDGLFPSAATADGQLAAWQAVDFRSIPFRFRLAYRDLPSGEAGLLDVGTIRHVRAHPNKPVLFLSFQSGAIGRLDANGLRTFPVCSIAPSDLAVSPNGDVLAALCGGVPIVDADSGTILRRLTLPMPLQSLQFTANKNRLVGLRHYFLIPQPAEIVGLFDATTGEMLQSVQSSIGGKPSFHWIYVNPAGDRVYAAVGTSFGSRDAEVIALDAETLALQKQLPLLAVTRLVETHDRTHAVALLQPDSASRLIRAAMVDLASNTVLGPWDVGYYWTPHAPMLISVSPPLAPSSFTSSVLAQRVTFNIEFPTGSPASTSYLVEAADAAAPADIYPFQLRVPATGSQLVLDGVPSGNYRVRVRGANAVGDGPPSGAILVTVR